MRLLILFLISIIANIAVVSGKAAKVCGSKHCYHRTSIGGWNIYYSEKVVLDDKFHFQIVSRKIKSDLSNIQSVLSKDNIEKLQKISVFVNLDDPLGRHQSAAYHPSREWLASNGYDPIMAKSVEIANTSNYLSWTNHQPALLLHEFAHAYHDQFTTRRQKKAIKELYLSSKEEGKYLNVPYYDGRLGKAYALTNQREYFAEATEAFLWRNDFFPFTKSDLLNYDSELYHLLSTVWVISAGNFSPEMSLPLLE